ncbi:MAG: NYN domain-containing protein, partial [Mycobacterium sp.]
MTENIPDALTPAADGPAIARVLLVWDAPNLDMGLGSILGGRPTAAHRPRFDALGRWLLARTADLSAHIGANEHTLSLEPEATVFTNIAPGSADVVRPWVEALRNVGFAVFAKPKLSDDCDVDSDMLAHIALRRGEGLAGLIVASADGQAFKLPLEDLARDGIPVQVLGFREHASWALASDTLEFVDLEDIDGVFR